jgi:hypothetical protein
MSKGFELGRYGGCIMEIEILDIVKTDKEDKFGKPTRTLAVNYISEGVTRTQNIVPFANPKVFSVLDDASVGDKFDVTITKNGKYDNWSAIGPVGSFKQATPTTKVIGSNYETAEERAIKQRYIVRQSSLANAISYYNASLDKPTLHVKDIIDIAKQFEEYVFEPAETL